MNPSPTPTTIRICIVEDDSGIRTTLERMINESPGFQCLETYPDAETALKKVPQVRPDVVLMDINLPGMSGIDCVRQLKPQVPGLRIVMLTVYDDSDLVFRSLMAGADGYLLKRTTREKLLESLTEINSGGAPMSKQIARRVIQYFHDIQMAPAPAAPPPRARPKPEPEDDGELRTLTEREHEILGQLAKGFSYKEISSNAGISVETVRSHIRKIYEKLQVHSRTQAVLKYLGKS